MKKNAFTLVEVIAVVVIIGILATLTLPNFLNVLENSKDKVCEINLKALSIALDEYVMEHDVVPANLSLLPPEYIKNAYTRLLKERGAWKIKLAYFMLERFKSGLAYAQPFINIIAKGDLKLITCPNDTTPPASGGISYGLNSELSGKGSADYQAISGDKILIGDCEYATFSDSSSLESRHKVYQAFLSSEYYAKGVRKDKKRIRRRGTEVEVEAKKRSSLPSATNFEKE